MKKKYLECQMIGRRVPSAQWTSILYCRLSDFNSFKNTVGYLQKEKWQLFSAFNKFIKVCLRIFLSATDNVCFCLLFMSSLGLSKDFILECIKILQLSQFLSFTSNFYLFKKGYLTSFWMMIIFRAFGQTITIPASKLQLCYSQKL